MPIVGPAFEKLRDALASAFNNRESLDDLTSFDMDTPLTDISPKAENHPTAVKAVIRWADSLGQLEKLISKAKARRPDNQLLKQIDATQLSPDHEPGDVVAAGTGGDFDAKLSGVVDQLASGNAIKQTSAVAALQALTGTLSRQEQLALYSTTIANLRVKYPKDVQRALAKVFESSITSLFEDADERPDDVLVDLNRISLPRVNLSGLDLREADIAFADLANADLTKCNLWRARGYGVDLSKARLSRGTLEEARLRSAVAPKAHFHETRMISARFEDADLAGAEFQQALLQGARLNGADLTGARFEGAKVADADFRDATFDDAAAKSLSRADKWRKAKLSPADFAAVEGHSE